MGNMELAAAAAEASGIGGPGGIIGPGAQGGGGGAIWGHRGIRGKEEGGGIAGGFGTPKPPLKQECLHLTILSSVTISSFDFARTAPTFGRKPSQGAGFGAGGGATILVCDGTALAPRRLGWNGEQGFGGEGKRPRPLSAPIMWRASLKGFTLYERGFVGTGDRAWRGGESTPAARGWGREKMHPPYFPWDFRRTPGGGPGCGPGYGGMGNPLPGPGGTHAGLEG